MIKPERWKPADGLTLEPNALTSAMETSRSLALTAGPGAGKTEMLAQRADFLLRTGTSYYPQRILAISFKVDASRNLKERVRRRCGPDLASRLDSYTFHAFAKRLIDRFRPVLTGLDALDPDYTIGEPRVHRRQIGFSELVPLAVDILRDSLVARNAVRQTYSHVFLDEFQDCTDAQYKLIHAAFGGTRILLTAVGDTKQCIMAWAGALEGIFQTFATEFSAVPLSLYQNFRSEPRLRRMQNAMVKVMDPQAAVPDDQLAGKDGIVEILIYEDNHQEALDLAAKIQSLITNDGVVPSEIAVLVSRQLELYAALLMSALTDRGIAYRNEVSLQDLSAEPAARLIVDFLSVIVAEREPDAYRRLMDTLVDTRFDEDDAYELRARWHRFIDDARMDVRRVPESALDADGAISLARRFLDQLGKQALVALSADYEQGARLEEVISLTYQRIKELSQADGKVAIAVAKFSEDNGVRLMTIHKSKGLEFDTVVILGVEEETFWGDANAERSAYFVGISRAKRRLFLSVARRRPKPQGANSQWRVARTPHAEFLGYVAASN
jgi:superfamily I DNA/RNA helicase